MTTAVPLRRLGVPRVFEHNFTYLAGVQRNSHRFANPPALHDPASGRRWTYAELWADTGRLADGAPRPRRRARRRVVFAFFNGPEFVLAWLAAQRLGAIAAPINFRLSAGEVAYVLDDSRPRRSSMTRRWQSPPPTRSRAPSTSREAWSLSVRRGRRGRHAVRRAPQPGDPHADPDPPPDATIYDETTRLYTSGTTGMPKGVSLSSLVEVLSAHDVIMHFPLSPEDRTLNMTPWFHRGGLYSGGPNPVLYVGAEAVALRQFDPATVLDWVQEHRLTFLIGAPTNLALLTAEQSARPRDLSSLNGIVTMGAPLDREACLRYQELLTPGSSTATAQPRRSGTPSCGPSDLPEHAGSAGRACTDDDVAVVKIYEDRTPTPTTRPPGTGARSAR